jgi:uncharacterized protein with von Willebrand factor type A (vWA) domain
MERYSRMLLHFAHALTRRQRRVEAFLYLDRAHPHHQAAARQADCEAVGAVARSSARLVGRDAHRAGDPAISSVLDAAGTLRGWSGGAAHLGRLGPRRSPGLARPDCPAAAELPSLIWLNPLIGTDGYEPLTRGLQAALPYVDDFPAGADAHESRRPGATLEHAVSRAVHWQPVATANCLMDITGSYTFNAPH